MNRKSVTLLGTLVVLILLATQCLFTVHQTEQAIILQLGQPNDRIYGPGLHVKVPFIQNVLYFDKRILDYDAKPAEAITSDMKTIVLDNYARWKIVDPLQFYRKLKTIAGAQDRLNRVFYALMREQVGQHSLTEVVTTERTSIMTKVTEDASERMREFGIEVVDVRIRRTDLPAENLRAIFGRMKAERERMAKQYRSEGEEEATKIRSTADKDRALILADANRSSQILRGEGDARAAAVFAEAFSKSPDFFEFQRGLEALRKSLNNNTRIILTPDSPVLSPLR